MDKAVQQALKTDRTIDITTTGRKSGRPRKTEIWFYNIDGRLFICGPGGKRDWYANILAHPDITFHLKESTMADLPATALPITDTQRRRQIFAAILKILDQPEDLDNWTRSGPLVEIKLKDGSV
jgi:deazaflavin-dependent oxidoreductase (nitroreductase family)